MSIASLVAACLAFTVDAHCVAEGHRPETWFHLIGGNVSKAGITSDLEAIKAAGFGGIQFFHGETEAIWPGVDEPIRCMSDKWEDVVAHLGRECARLGLTLRLQNCPGWSMSGGPWIDDAHAMRKIVVGGKGRDYRPIASVTFPSCAGEAKGVQVPDSVETNGDVRTFAFSGDVTLRSLALPSASCYNHAFSYEPGLRAKLDVWRNGDWVPVFDRAYPRSNYSDKQMAETFSFKPTTGRKWRLEIAHEHPIVPRDPLSGPVFSSAVRLDGWEGKAGWTLREAMPLPSETLTNEFSSGMQTLVFGHVNAEKKNHPAPPEATGWECDKLDPKGVEASFDGYLARMLDGPLRNVPVKGVLIDSWECGSPMWTEKMPDYFLRINGYDIRKWLPCLFGHVVESPAATESFLRDWRQTQGELVKEHYYRRFAELAHARGLDVSYETAMGDVIAGDILSYWKYADVPMCEFWSPHDDAAGHVTSYDYKPVRPCVSAAHIYGKPRVAAEAFTSFKLTWNETLADFKREADRFLARGITHLVFHTYTHDPRVGGLPPGSSFSGNIGSPFVRGQSWWRHMPLLTDYLARCEELLESGRPVVDVLWYLGDDCAHKPSEKAPFPEGFKYDYCTFDALSSRADVRDGRIAFPDGMRYSVLWVPDGYFVTEASERRIAELESRGAHVVRGGLVDLEKDLSRLVPDVVFDPPKTGRPDDFMWYHRHAPKEDVYFLATSSKNGYSGNVRFRAGGLSSRVEIPQFGSVFVRISENGGKLEYPSHPQLMDCLATDVVRKRVCLRSCHMTTPYFLSPEQTYRTSLSFSASDIRNGIALDFGDERDVLEVCVNGSRVTKLWCPPYVCMISDMAVVGENEIEVVRTGTWQKRLQYDRTLPVEHRMTWIP